MHGDGYFVPSKLVQTKQACRQQTCPSRSRLVGSRLVQSKGWVEGDLFSSKFVKMLFLSVFSPFWQFPFNFGTGRSQCTLCKLEPWESLWEKPWKMRGQILGYNTIHNICDKMQNTKSVLPPYYMKTSFQIKSRWWFPVIIKSGCHYLSKEKPAKSKPTKEI